METRVEAYDYEHPAEAVAQVPAERREGARLLFVHRGAPGVLRDGTIPDLVPALRSGDLLVVNHTRVLPARLVARRATGGRVSVLVLAPRAASATVLLGARGRLVPGERLDVHGDTWVLQAALGEGRYEVVVENGRPVEQLLRDKGRMPLPPYIERGPEVDARDALDRERYQTTFAGGQGVTAEGVAGGGVTRGGAAEGAVDHGVAARGAVGERAPEGHAIAAPTAGLHLTPGLLDALRARGVAVASLRLDVGQGTFQPLRGQSLDEHVMHAESYVVGDELAERFAATRAAGGRIVAVGTTVVRTLESVVTPDGRELVAGVGETRLFLRPGARFRAVDALLTNFHQPRSTLLVLVAAFAGLDTIRAAYAHAIARGYRLFSYGDAMLLADDPGG